MTPEAKVIEAIKKHVKGLGGKVIKLNQTGFSEIGTPDLIVITPRYITCLVEVKAKGKKPEPIQLQRIKEIKEAGGRSFWCDSLESFIYELERHTF